MKKVYSPCADPIPYSFDSKPRVLPPKTVSNLPDGEARLVIEQFGDFGVCMYHDEVGDDIKVAANIVWEGGNRKWAEQTILDWRKNNKEKIEAGIPLEEPNDVKAAKKFLKIAGVILGMLLWVAPVFAQELRTANAAYLYDVDSTTKTYCTVAGQGGDPFGSPIQVQGRIDTVGSSQTVTEVTTGDNPFDEVAVGDIIIVDKGVTGIDVVAVDAKTDATQITVHEAVNWSAGYSFRYYDVTCGTAVTNGWIPVGGYEVVHLAVDYEQGDLGGLDVALECRYGGLGTPRVQVYPGAASDCGFGTLNTNVCTYTSTTFPSNHIAFAIANSGFQECRAALAYRTSDTSDVGANRELVTVTVAVTRHR